MGLSSPRPRRRSTPIRSPLCPSRRTQNWPRLLWITSSPPTARRCSPRQALLSADQSWQSRVPLLLAVPAAVGLLFLVLPLVGLVMRAPWADAGAVLTSQGALQALRLSMITSTVSVIIVVIIGVPLAWLLAWPGLRGTAVLRALITIPLRSEEHTSELQSHSDL